METSSGGVWQYDCEYRKAIKKYKQPQTQTPEHTPTDQRGSAGAPAERLVEGRAAELQLLQVTVGDSDISRQGQALVEVLKHTHIRKYLTFLSLSNTK